MTDLASRAVQVVTVYRQGPPGPGGAPGDGLQVLPGAVVRVRAGEGIAVDADGVHVADGGVTTDKLGAAAVTPDKLHPATREQVEDWIAALLVAGANISLAYDDLAGSITIGVAGLDAGDIGDFRAALYSELKTMLDVGPGVTIDEVDGAETLFWRIGPSQVVTSMLAPGAVTAAKVAADVATQAELDAAVAAVNAGLPPTIRNVIGAALVDSATVNLTYDALAGTITAAVLDAPTVGGSTAEQLRDRATHTGTQLAATIADFNAAVRTNRLDQMAAPTAPVNLGGQRGVNAADPVDPLDLVTKQYAESLRSGLDLKQSVRALVATNVNLAAPGAVLGGVALLGGDRVYLVGQAASEQNGIYNWVGPAVPMVRAPDADSSAEVTNGMAAYVSEGDAAGQRWVLVTPDPIALGATPLTFSQDSGLAQLVAGGGLTKSGNVIAVGAGPDIQVNADTVQLAPATRATIDGLLVDVAGHEVDIGALDADIATEQLRAEGAEAVLTADLADEVVRATAAEATKVDKATLNANTVLGALVDDTPVALTGPQVAGLLPADGPAGDPTLRRLGFGGGMARPGRDRPNEYDLREWGPIDTTGVTDHYPAFADILAAIEADNPVGDPRGARFKVPKGKIRSSHRLVLRRQMIMEGQGGSGWFPATDIIFDPGVGGIELWRPPSTPDIFTQGRSDWTVVRDLAVSGTSRHSTVRTTAPDGAMALGSNVLNSASLNATTDDIGRKVSVPLAFVAGIPLVATIVGVNAPGQVVLDQAASTAVAGQVVSVRDYHRFATDASAAAGANVITSTGLAVTADDIGRTVVLVGAGPAGAIKVEMITQVDSPTQFRIFTNIDTTVADVRIAIPAHGVYSKCTAVRLENVYARDFAGHGFNCDSQSGGDGSGINANLDYVDHCTADRCFDHGLHTKGVNSNAGLILGFNAQNNDGWGIFEGSFLGNTYVGVHNATNALGSYWARLAGVAPSVFIGCYEEQDQPQAQIDAQALVVGGSLATNLHPSSTGGAIRAVNGSVLVSNSLGIINDKHADRIEAYLGGTDALRTALRWASEDDGGFDWKLRYEPGFDAGWWYLLWGNGVFGAALGLSTSQAAEGGGKLAFPEGFFMGWAGNKRQHGYGFAPPASGAHVVGEVWYNLDTSPGSPLQWVCSVAGTPGTWTPLYALRVQDEGADLTRRPTLNFAGAGVSVADDPVNNRTNVTIAGGGGGGGADLSALLHPTGIKAEAMPRASTFFQDIAILASGRLSLTAVALGADTYDELTFWSGGTPANAPTHQWFCLYDDARNLIEVTSDDGATAWAANTRKTLPLDAPVVVAVPGLYYVGVVVVATTPPSVIGLNPAGVTLMDAAPSLSHIFSNAGLTDPASAPAVANVGFSAGFRIWAGAG